MKKPAFKFLDASNIDALKSQADKLLKKTLNRHVKLAVTGLSRSGKSAFITSLVHHLCHQANPTELPFVEAIRDGRYIGAKKIPQTSLHVPSFAYAEGLSCLQADEPSFPPSTSNISELRLAIRYRPAEGIISQLSDLNTLHVDIIDYPGEWLMDLPMLSLDYAKWSATMAQLFETEPRKSESAEFFELMAKIDLHGPINEPLLKQVADVYAGLLKHFKQNLGLSLLQPGRFILPGELEGAPILQFVPWLGPIASADLENAQEGSNLAALIARFEEYKNRVVKGFYNDYFKHFDRQIVLVDCLAPLNSGQQSFNELQRSLEWLLQSYDYGQNDLLRRLFSPRIDKLLFAASKADHVTVEQHKNLALLLNKLVASSRNTIQYEGIEIDTLAMSSIKATLSGFVEHQGQKCPCIEGVSEIEGEKKSVTLYPGEVPTQIPTSEYWQQNDFNFVSFEPPRAPDGKLSHIRLDHVIEFLLGDKLR